MPRMVDAEGLKHAPEAVAQMEAEQEQGEDVPGGNPPHAESADDVVVDIAFDEMRLRMDVAGGELQQVEDDEGQDDGAAPVHGAVSVVGIDRLLDLVADGPGFAIAQGQLDGGHDVQQHGDDQHQADDPEQFADACKKVAVGIDPRGALEHLQIAGR